jgi:hypothetical protein
MGGLEAHSENTRGQKPNQDAMDDAGTRDQAHTDASTVAKKQPGAITATSAGRDQQDKQQHVAPRKLLLILHGKRIEDDQVRDAIKQLKDEGHEVMPAAVDAATASPATMFCIAFYLRGCPVQRRKKSNPHCKRESSQAMSCLSTQCTDACFAVCLSACSAASAATTPNCRWWCVSRGTLVMLINL